MAHQEQLIQGGETLDHELIAYFVAELRDPDGNHRGAKAILMAQFERAQGTVVPMSGEAEEYIYAHMYPESTQPRRYGNPRPVPIAYSNFTVEAVLEAGLLVSNQGRVELPVLKFDSIDLFPPDGWVPGQAERYQELDS